MSSKLYSVNPCSQLEAHLNNLEQTNILFFATHFVNPIWENLVGKVIYVTLPINIDLSELSKYNKIISRYPLDSMIDSKVNYDLIPYDEVERTPGDESKQYSSKILNKYMLDDSNSNLSDENYLIGSDETVNGFMTTVGYIVSKSIN